MSILLKLASRVSLVVSVALAAPGDAAEPMKYCRFQAGDMVAYGIVEGDTIRQIDGDLFGQWAETDKTHRLDVVQLLVPSKPSQVFAMAGNYRSHVAQSEKQEGNASLPITSIDAIPEQFRIPQPFYKPLSCLQRYEGEIVLPKDAGPVHYEAEMVIVIGRKARHVPKTAALDYVFGVTCGNDISERAWQKNDVQWWRAKGTDTFGPCGPFIVSGINYDDLRIQLRHNGTVKQDARTNELIHDVATLVSFISQYVTMQPGDLIFTGTSGTTEELKPGDIVEVELENVGVLRNHVVAGE